MHRAAYSFEPLEADGKGLALGALVKGRNFDALFRGDGYSGDEIVVFLHLVLACGPLVRVRLNGEQHRTHQEPP